MNDYLLGRDKNGDGHLEYIELDDGDLFFNKLSPYANEDSLETAYQHVVNQ